MVQPLKQTVLRRGKYRGERLSPGMKKRLALDPTATSAGAVNGSQRPAGNGLPDCMPGARILRSYGAVWATAVISRQAGISSRMNVTRGRVSPSPS